MLEYLDILGMNIPISFYNNSIHMEKVVENSFVDFHVRIFIHFRQEHFFLWYW